MTANWRRKCSRQCSSYWIERTARRAAAKAVAETEFGETLETDVRAVSMMFWQTGQRLRRRRRDCEQALLNKWGECWPLVKILFSNGRSTVTNFLTQWLSPCLRNQCQESLVYWSTSLWLSLLCQLEKWEDCWGGSYVGIAWSFLLDISVFHADLRWWSFPIIRELYSWASKKGYRDVITVGARGNSSVICRCCSLGTNNNGHEHFTVENETFGMKIIFTKIKAIVHFKKKY